MEAARTIVAVKFKWGDALYDYYADFPVEVGQRVYVPTKKGETKAEIVEIRTESEKVEKSILRLVEDLRTDDERAAKHPNGQRMFSEDRTMLNDKGNRSIFDDVDQ